MRHSHRLGFRVARATASASLVGALLFVTPTVALAREGRGADRAASPASAQGGHGPAENGSSNAGGQPAAARAADEVEGTPAADRGAPFATDESTPAEAPSSPAGDPPPTPADGKQTADLPDPASETAEVATSAERTPAATAEAVTDTSPAPDVISDTPASEAGSRRPAELPAALIEPADPVPHGDVDAAGTTELTAAPVPFTPITTTQATGFPAALALDPLVPASLGLLLLARALRRKPARDDRSFSL